MPIDGGVEQPILTDWGYWGSYAPDAKKIAFNRHPMVWWRQHYRGSYSADLWVLDMGTQKYRQLVDDKTPDEEKANNFWPMYGNGGEIYFVSDRATKAKSGSPEVMKSVNNIWRVNDSTGALTQVTFHKSGVLFWPSMSSDGNVIVYEQGFGLWKLDTATGKTTPITINIASDDQVNNHTLQTFDSECDSFHLSPSAKRGRLGAWRTFHHRNRQGRNTPTDPHTPSEGISAGLVARRQMDRFRRREGCRGTGLRVRRKRQPAQDGLERRFGEESNPPRRPIRRPCCSRPATTKCAGMTSKMARPPSLPAAK